jgi:gluconolactonase
MAAALAFAHYDHSLVVGPGEHDLEHATAILPAALRWLWRDYHDPITAPTSGPIFDDLLLPNHPWEQVGDTYLSTVHPAADKAGIIYFADPASSRIYSIAPDDSVAIFREGTAGAKCLVFGPDERLYAIQAARRRIVSYGPDGDEEPVAEGVDAYAIAVTEDGAIFFTDPVRNAIMVIDTTRRNRPVYEDGAIGAPAALAMSPDQAFLAVLDAESLWGWSFQTGPDHSLRNGQPFFRVQGADQISLRRVQGIAVDTQGELYIPTASGITVSTQTGRSREIINAPEPGVISAVAFGGPKRDWLYAAENGQLFRRRIRRRGAVSWERVKPPSPQL